MDGKTYWVGDDRDNKSVHIERDIYVKGDEIPTANVAQDLLDEWKKNGLIAVGDSAAPVVIIDTEAVKNLKTEIVSLTRETDRIPGLEREVSELKKAAEKAKGGTKAKRVKELEADVKAKDARIKELEEYAVKGGDHIEKIELDNQEKAALIDKLNTDLEEATAPDKDASKEKAEDLKADLPPDEGAGPGGD